MISQANSQAVKVLEVADDPRLSREVKAFLKVLNSGGVPLEILPPLEAPQVLADAQASVQVNLSGIDESEKTISLAELAGTRSLFVQAAAELKKYLR